jgi:phage/plasmid-associated DNA primase
MHQDFYTFRLGAKAVLDTNIMPKLDDNSSAMRERMLVIQFNGAIPQEERMSRGKVDEILRNEAAGIFQWAWRGLQRVIGSTSTDILTGSEDDQAIIDGNLITALSSHSKDVRDEIVYEQDVMMQWFDACFDVTKKGNDVVSFKELFNSWIMYSINSGVIGGPGSIAELGRRLELPSGLLVKKMNYKGTVTKCVLGIRPK